MRNTHALSSQIRETQTMKGGEIERLKERSRMRERNKKT
jgi:hypothetical protein